MAWTVHPVIGGRTTTAVGIKGKPKSGILAIVKPMCAVAGGTILADYVIEQSRNRAPGTH